VEVGAEGDALDGLADAICERTRLVILANPNNPTGATFGEAAWQRLLARIPPEVVVAIDEAYGEYVLRGDYPRALQAVAAGHPVIVVRSFSKVYGLAGLRLGYGVAAAPLARRIAAQLQQFNTSRLAQAAAVAALGDDAHLARCVALNALGRRFLRAELFGLGLGSPPSEANFLLVSVPHAPEVCRALRDRGVLVKTLEGYGIPDAFRVTVGRPEDNERFVEALRDSLAARREPRDAGRS
jgi:histidinol-phosphate aminotransferase